MKLAFDKFEEQIFLNTVLIENLTDNEAGTGFIISKPTNDGKSKILLFSNKHVFWGKKDKNTQNIEKMFRLTFHKLDENGEYILGATHSFTGKIKRDVNTGYYDHMDEGVDVGCANISNLTEKGVKLNLVTLSIADFCTYERAELNAGMKILFVGYPSIFYDRKNFLPVMRSGTIASIPIVDFNGESSILLDAQIFPGSSGSPVFTTVRGTYKLIGIVSSGIRKGLDFVEIHKSTDAKMEVTNLPVEWLGLGLLFTSDTIKEVYDLA